MKKYIRSVVEKSLAVIMVVSIAFCPVVYAQAEENVGDELEIEESNRNLLEELSQFQSYSFDDVIINDCGIALLDGTGDSYETNNGPSVATVGRYNLVTYGTIHEVNDVDWYKIEITDINTPISVILTNIPNNCDYDMYLVKYDSTNGITKMYNNLQQGTVSEELYGYVDEIGTYYVVVQPDTTVANNFSTSNYKLYMGNYFRNGSYGWVNSGARINFGYHPTGTTTNTYSNWYSINLTNEISIPQEAVLTKFYLDSNGNGAYWAGFYKELRANTQQATLGTKLGGIEVMYSGDNQYWVKQDWGFRGYLMVSNNFVWEPRILISYKYPVTLQNLRFV